MKKTYFTFGQGHAHHVNGVTFDPNCVVVVVGENPRQQMFDHFGDKWCFEYDQKYLDEHPDFMDLFPRGFLPLSGKKWIGNPVDTKCDMCYHKFDKLTLVKNCEYFVDGATGSGPWALMCPSCFERYGVGALGPGRGQKYDGPTFVKLEG